MKYIDLFVGFILQHPILTIISLIVIIVIMGILERRTK